MARMSSLGSEPSDAVVASEAAVDDVGVCLSARAAERVEGEVGKCPAARSRRGLGKGDAKRAVETVSVGGSGSTRRERGCSRRPSTIVVQGGREVQARQTTSSQRQPG